MILLNRSTIGLSFSSYTYVGTVMVTTQDNSAVLFQGVLHHGEYRMYNQNNLVATVDPAQNTEVIVRGKVVSKGKQGKAFFFD